MFSYHCALPLNPKWFSEAVSVGWLGRVLPAREGGIEHGEGGSENDGAGREFANRDLRGCPRMSGKHVG